MVFTSPLSRQHLFELFLPSCAACKSETTMEDAALQSNTPFL